MAGSSVGSANFKEALRLTGEKLTFRRMLEQDVEQVMVVERKAYPYPWTEGVMRDCLQGRYYCLVCLHDEKIIGHAVISVAAGEAHILNLAIEPNQQGRGFGRMFLDYLLEQARQRNVRMVFLEVRSSNRSAATLYHSAGFNEMGLRRGYYPADGGREDAVVYGLTL